ncbi:MAG: ATP synthase F1 subunit delta [Acidimicrobiia bacterium]
MADRIPGYASAIFEVATAEGKLDEVEDELFRVARTLEASSELRDALADPRLPAERKQAVIGDLLEDKASPVTRALVALVVGLGRAKQLPQIADLLVERAAAERNKAVAEVRTAVPLDKRTLDRLAKGLSKATGKQVEVKLVVDPSVIGGVVARVGNTVIDGSVRHRLESLREKLNTR